MKHDHYTPAIIEVIDVKIVCSLILSPVLLTVEGFDVWFHKHDTKYRLIVVSICKVSVLMWGCWRMVVCRSFVCSQSDFLKGKVDLYVIKLVQIFR